MNCYSSILSAILLLMFLATTASAYTIDGGGVCSAANCTDTTDALNDNINCYTEVRLTADIANYSSTCIDNPANFSNKILNCQGRTIDGTDAIVTHGIYLNGKSNNTIKNCIVSDFVRGIWLNSSSNNTLTNNTANSNIYSGILLGSSSNNTLTNNTANSNTYDGIRLESSSNNNTLTNNTALNNGDGILLSYSNYNTLTNNTALNNGDGIYLSSSNYSTLTNNTANSNSQYGILLSYSNYNTLTNNTANSNSQYGIFLLYYSNNNTLTNNTASNNGYGIYLSLSRYSTLTNNIANSNNNDGIYLGSSNYSTLTNNTASSNDYGIDLSSSNYSTLTKNIVSSNNYGIRLSSSSNNTLTNNTANSNIYSGIRLYSSSNNNTLTNNTALNNSDGIYLDSSSSNSLTGNNMSGNSYNLFVWGSTIPHFVQTIDTSNTVDGKPVYYLVGVSNQVIDSSTGAGYVGVVNSINVTVKDLALTRNGQGVLVVNTTNSFVLNNNASLNNLGIALLYSNYSTLTNNTASNNSYGIGVGYSSNYNTLTNNTITTSGNDSAGLYLYFAENTTIDGDYYNITSGNGEYGAIICQEAQNNTIKNTRIITNINAVRGYYDGVCNLRIFDSTITSGATYSDVRFDGNVDGTINLTNVTFNRSKISFGSGSTGLVYVKWYVDVYVNYSNGAPAEGANVLAYDVNNNLRHNETTNASGWWPRQDVTEFVQYATGTYNSNNYSFNATYDGYVSKTKLVNVTENLIAENNNNIVLTLSRYPAEVLVTIAASVIISLPVSSINFGSMQVGQSNNTEDNNPPPFIIQNDGSVNVNITINATQLWSGTGATGTSSYYQFKSAENESGSVVNTTQDLVDWTNMPIADTAVKVANRLRFTNAYDTVKVHVSVTVPVDEPAGAKSSTVTFTGVQA